VEAKHRDYYLCIRVIVSELVEFQRLGGIEWSLDIEGKSHPCCLQIPVNCIIGDTEGADKLCARKLNRMAGNLCPSCDIPFEELEHGIQ
jgi:hypothetical protein